MFKDVCKINALVSYMYGDWLPIVPLKTDKSAQGFCIRKVMIVFLQADSEYSAGIFTVTYCMEILRSWNVLHTVQCISFHRHPTHHSHSLPQTPTNTHPIPTHVLVSPTSHSNISKTKTSYALLKSNQILMKTNKQTCTKQTRPPATSKFNNIAIERSFVTCQVFSWDLL